MELLEVGRALRERQDRHHLGGGGDVVAGLPLQPVRAAAQGDAHAAQGPVVEVDGAAPEDRLRVKPEPVPLVQVVVEESGQEVVRRGDGVEVSGEVQIDLLHRHHLGVAAPGRAPLHAEDRSHRRLADGAEGAATEAP